MAVLDELLRVRDLSTRQWADKAGASLATIYRVSQPGAHPTSLTVARLGLAAGLRLELAPLREQNAPQRQRQRPPALPADPPAVTRRVDAAFLLALAGAELRHQRRMSRRLSAGDVAAELNLSAESVLRAERPRAPWAHLEALETLALAAGCSLTWQPVGAGWRLRPWQKRTSTLTPERQRALARKAGIRGALYLSLDDTWRTPRPLFEELDREFGFCLDAAALSTNALCPDWLGPDHPNPHRRDALRWPDGWADVAHEAGPGGWVFVNAPYGVGLPLWSSRAADTAKNGVGCVGLLPARTDTRWWHRDVLGRGAETRFVKGRLHFNDGGQPAPFASVLVIWRP